MLNTNARSLIPKIESFTEYLNELGTSVAFLTETWLSDSTELKNDIIDYELGTGYSIICKNRPRNSRGYSSGGVAIAYRKSHLSMKEIVLPGNNFELLFTEGTLPRFSRKFIAICCYMPPSLSSSSAKECLEFIVDAILEIKSRYKDPYIAIAGDFNEFKIDESLLDYPDIQCLKTAPTRGIKTLDLIFTNFSENIVESGVIDPLEADGTGADSDHKVVYCTAHLKRFAAFEWQKFTFMKQTQSGNEKFKSWIINQDWQAVIGAVGSTNKAAKYQELINEAMAECYPIITVKKKSTDDPWITEKIRKRIKQRKFFFKKQGRSKAWKKLKKITRKMIKLKREQYIEKHKIVITSPGAAATFFKNVRSYNTAEKPSIWDIKSIRPALSDADLALELSLYFNRISSEFSPLTPEEVPSTFHRDLPVLRPYQVAERVRRIKKPRSKIVSQPHV